LQPYKVDDDDLNDNDNNVTMTFLNVKLLKIRLCIAISPLVVHAEKK